MTPDDTNTPDGRADGAPSESLATSSVGSGALFCASLEWHKGPALGGRGTAGKEEGRALWWDGDQLLIAVETNKGREVALVNVVADEEVWLVCANTGDRYDAWTLNEVSWWARIGKKTLPPESSQNTKMTNAESEAFYEKQS